MIDWSNPINWAEPINRQLVYRWEPIRHTIRPASTDIIAFREITGRTMDCAQFENSPTFSRDAPCDWLGSIDLSGGSDKLNIGDTSKVDFGAGDFAFAAWIKPDALPTGTRWMIVGKDAISNQRQFVFGKNSVAINDLTIAYFTTPAAAAILEITSPLDTTDKWYFILGQRVGNSFEIYVDGLLAGSGTTSGSHGTMQSTSAQLQLGAREIAADEFDGHISTVWIYERSLKAAEVWALYLDVFSGYRRTLNHVRLPPIKPPGAISVTPTPLTASWSAVTPITKLSRSPSPLPAAWTPVAGSTQQTTEPASLSATWSPVSPSTTVTAIPSALTASWLAVTATTTLQTSVSAVSASWTTVEPAAGISVSPSALSASWTVQAPTTDLTSSPAALTATWAAVEPVSQITTDAPALSASWTAVEPVVFTSTTPVPLIASWTVPAPTSSLQRSVSPLSLSWAVTVPLLPIVISVSAVSAAWTVVVPSSQLTTSPSPLALSWTLNVGAAGQLAALEICTFTLQLTQVYNADLQTTLDVDFNLETETGPEYPLER